MKTMRYAAPVMLAFCVHTACAQTLGEGGSKVSGSAGPNGASSGAPELLKCDKPFGTIAVAEPQDYTMRALSQYGLPSYANLLRLMIQQSNCFQVVERGIAMQNIMQERALSQGGQLQGGSNMGQGQMVTADFVMTADVVFSQNDAGGAGGGLAALGGLFGNGGRVLGAIAGGVKFKEAQTSLLLADARSSLQVASATGSARQTDWNVGGFLAGGGAAAGLGAYQNTAEGKVIAASLLDNYNQVVKSIRGNSSLIAPTSASSQANAAGSIQAGVPMNTGDTVAPKINGVKIYKSPGKTGKVVATLKREDELIVTGAEQGGFVPVQGEKGEGWAEKIMLRK